MKILSPKRKFRYTHSHESFLHDGYVSMSRRDLTQAFNARFGTVLSEGRIKVLLRSYKIRSGRTGQFKPECVPWNRGRKGYIGANVTSFQTGHIPHNKRRLWFERVTRDGYIEISVPESNPYTGAPTRFKLKHVWLWEAAHGPLPKGYIVIFKDGDRRNCVIHNLLSVRRVELLVLNTLNYREAHKELKPSVLALAKLEAKAGIRSRPGRGR